MSCVLKKKTLVALVRKKQTFLNEIPKLSDNDLYDTNIFLADLLKECTNEMRYRSSGEK